MFEVVLWPSCILADVHYTGTHTHAIAKWITKEFVVKEGACLY